MATSTSKDSTKKESKAKTKKTASTSKSKTTEKKVTSSKSSEKSTTKATKNSTHKVKSTTTTKKIVKKTTEKDNAQTAKIKSLVQDEHIDTEQTSLEKDLSDQVTTDQNIPVDETETSQLKNVESSVEESKDKSKLAQEIKEEKAQPESTKNIPDKDFIIKPSQSENDTSDHSLSNQDKSQVTSLWLNEDIKNEVEELNNADNVELEKDVVLDSELAASVSTFSLNSQTDDVDTTSGNDEISQSTSLSERTNAHDEKDASSKDNSKQQSGLENDHDMNSQDALNKPLKTNATNIDSKEDSSENLIEEDKDMSKTTGKIAKSTTDHTNLGESKETIISLSNSAKSKPNSNEGTFNKKLLIPLILSILAFLGVLIYQFYIKNINYVKPYPEQDTVEKQNNTSNTATSSRDYENPINGVFFSNEEAAKFKDKKPVAIMVNNHEQARPSYGLSNADVVYEAVAEGGITRLMPIYHSHIPELVESVRSARYYFVELASGYKAHFFHWGGAHVPPCQKLSKDNPNYCPPVNGKVETNPKVDAYDRIVQLGLPNLDGGNYACTDDAPSCAFGRDMKRVNAGYPIEHTSFVRVPLALKLAKEVRPDASWHKYIPVTKWKFKDDAPLEERGDIGIDPMISYYYWKTPAAYAVDWKYDKEQNNYIRYQGKVKQIDAANNKELRAKVIVIRFTDQEPVGDKKNHLYHKLVGTGDALIFQDGKVIKAKWNRSTHEERDIYTDENGDQIAFNRGQIWIQLVPTGNPITYEKKSASLTVEGTPDNKENASGSNNTDKTNSADTEGNANDDNKANSN